MPAARADDDTLVDEHVARFDRRFQQTTDVAAQVQDQRVDRVVLELQYLPQLTRRLLAKCRDADVADAGLARQEVVPLTVLSNRVPQYRFRVNQFALDDQANRLLLADVANQQSHTTCQAGPSSV